MSVRRSRLARAGRRRATSPRAPRWSCWPIPRRLLSVTQVGVTLASLGLGWAGRADRLQILLRILYPLSLPPRTDCICTVCVSPSRFLAISFVHVVIGEVVPKNLASKKPTGWRLLMAPVAARSSTHFRAIRVRGGTRSAAVLRAAIGSARRPRRRRPFGRRTKIHLESSRREGHLEGFEEDAIQKLLELNEVYARQIMTPRIDIVSVSADATLDELLRITLEHKYSRMPVYEGKPEHIIGIRPLQGPGARLAANENSPPIAASPPDSVPSAALPARGARRARDQTAQSTGGRISREPHASGDGGGRVRDHHRPGDAGRRAGADLRRDWR